MIYLNLVASTALILTTFIGIQKNLKTLSCINKRSFLTHKSNLEGLVKKRQSFILPSLCQSKLRYEVSISGKVTNE